MAHLGTAVTASRVIPATYQLADAVVLFRYLVVYSNIATETETLALMTASAMMVTLGSAAIVGGGNVFVTSYLHLMLAAWNGAYDLYCATDRGRILGLPALG
jgi:hypothetical protein